MLEEKDTFFLFCGGVGFLCVCVFCGCFVAFCVVLVFFFKSKLFLTFSTRKSEKFSA